MALSANDEASQEEKWSGDLQEGALSTSAALDSDLGRPCSSIFPNFAIFSWRKEINDNDVLRILLLEPPI